MTESSRKIVEGQLQLQATDYGETSGERLQGPSCFGLTTQAVP